MVNTVMKKMKNRRGETLIETLVAISVFFFSSVMLYTMATTANDFNLTAQKADEDFQAQVVGVEQGKATGVVSKQNKSISITLVKSPGGASENMGSVSVNVYKGDDLYAYYVP